MPGTACPADGLKLNEKDKRKSRSCWLLFLLERRTWSEAKTSRRKLVPAPYGLHAAWSKIQKMPLHTADSSSAATSATSRYSSRITNHDFVDFHIILITLQDGRLHKLKMRVTSVTRTETRRR